jgi:hypothetical protein
MKKNVILASLVLLLVASCVAVGPHVVVNIVDVLTEISIGGGSYLTSSNQSGNGGYIVMTNASAPSVGDCLVGNGTTWQALTCPGGSSISGTLQADYAIQSFNANTSSIQQMKGISLSAGNVGSGNDAWVYRNTMQVIALNSSEAVNVCWQLASSSTPSCSNFQLALNDGTHTSWFVTIKVECGTQGSGVDAGDANCDILYDVLAGGVTTHGFVSTCTPSGTACSGPNVSGGAFEAVDVQFGTASATNTAYDTSQVVIKEN